MPYLVKLEVFEGPFDLLLHLIGRREIDIYDISIAEITDEYLAYMESLRELDLEIATEFLLIARFPTFSIICWDVWRSMGLPHCGQCALPMRANRSLR